MRMYAKSRKTQTFLPPARWIAAGSLRGASPGGGAVLAALVLARSQRESPDAVVESEDLLGAPCREAPIFAPGEISVRLTDRWIGRAASSRSGNQHAHLQRARPERHSRRVALFQ
jgi:hypothetical protein